MGIFSDDKQQQITTSTDGQFRLGLYTHKSVFYWKAMQGI